MSGFSLFVCRMTSLAMILLRFIGLVARVSKLAVDVASSDFHLRALLVGAYSVGLPTSVLCRDGDR